MSGDGFDALAGYLDRLRSGLEDPRALADSVGAALVESNRVDRLAGLDNEGRPLRAVQPRPGRGDGPPLAPYGAGSRVVTEYRTSIEPAGPTAFLIVAGWPSLPFIGYLRADGRDITGLSPSARARIEAATREYAENLVRPPGDGIA